MAENWKDLINEMDEITDEVKTEVGKAVKRAAMLVERDAKIKCAVDTGRLRNSISSKVTGIGTETPEFDVIVSASYAEFVEYGTSKMKAQPFLTPAFEENQDKINDMITQAIIKGMAK